MSVGPKYKVHVESGVHPSHDPEQLLQPPLKSRGRVPACLCSMFLLLAPCDSKKYSARCARAHELLLWWLKTYRDRHGGGDSRPVRLYTPNLRNTGRSSARNSAPLAVAVVISNSRGLQPYSGYMWPRRVAPACGRAATSSRSDAESQRSRQPDRGLVGARAACQTLQSILLALATSMDQKGVLFLNCLPPPSLEPEEPLWNHHILARSTFCPKP